MAAHVLLVDDEPAIRETLPQILGQHGFEVTVASSVAEALAAISSTKFDILLSDLNIGQPGDGFTVVSAMRRTQPSCITLILTGYPAFETALEAIRSQVDDFLIKPAPPRELLALIQRNLADSGQKVQRASSSKRVSDILRERADEVLQRTLAACKADPELASLQVSDAERVAPFRPELLELADMLDRSSLDAPCSRRLELSAERGRMRRAQGYSIPLVIASFRLLQSTIYALVGENLLALDISYVIEDIRRLSNCMTIQLQATVRAYLAADRHLVFSRSTKWTGWFCDRCCWNRPEPQSDTERASLAVRITAEFDAHTCTEPVRQE